MFQWRILLPELPHSLDLCSQGGSGLITGAQVVFRLWNEPVGALSVLSGWLIRNPFSHSAEARWRHTWTPRRQSEGPPGDRWLAARCYTVWDWEGTAVLFPFRRVSVCCRALQWTDWRNLMPPQCNAPEQDLCEDLSDLQSVNECGVLHTLISRAKANMPLTHAGPNLVNFWPPLQAHTKVKSATLSILVVPVE